VLGQVGDEGIKGVEVSLEDLQRLWKKRGFPAKSFSERNALLLTMVHGEDEDEDEDGTFMSFEDIDVEVLKGDMLGEVGEVGKSVMVAEVDAGIEAEASSDSLIMVPSGRSVGIDLGTTNSVISAMQGGRPLVIPVNSGRILPSVVAYLSDGGGTVVGERAQRQAATNGGSTFSSIKRVIGQTLGQVADLGDVQSLQMLRGGKSLVSRALAARKKSKKGGSGGGVATTAQNGQTTKSVRIKQTQNRPLESDSDALLACAVLGGTVTPEQASALILRELLDAAESHLKSGPIKKAVVTVPAYFAPSQCEATKRAAKLAGLEHVKLLREPEAAALAYGLNREGKQIVLVFDLGGGTFDVSVLDVGDDFVEVIATSGDAHLGGDDMDALVQDWIIAQCAAAWAPEGASAVVKTGLERRVRADAAAMLRIRVAAEAAKIDLSKHKATTIDLPMLLSNFKGTSTDVQDMPLLSAALVLTRGRFEMLIKPVLAGLARPLREAALIAGVNLQGESGQVCISSIDYEAELEEEEERVGDGERGASAPSARELRELQTEGRRSAKVRKKTAGKTRAEVRRLQASMRDPNIGAFPGGQLLDNVILVGGATRIPAVRRLIRTVTGLSPRRSVNPDEAVSLGASVLAGIMDGDIEGMQIMTAWQAAMYRAFYDEQVKGWGISEESFIACAGAGAGDVAKTTGNKDEPEPRRIRAGNGLLRKATRP
jgi:molecular chaperone DnaK